MLLVTGVKNSAGTGPGIALGLCAAAAAAWLRASSAAVLPNVS